MEIDIRNLDLVMEMLTCINDLCTKEPQKYREMIFKLQGIMKKYKDGKVE